GTASPGTTSLGTASCGTASPGTASCGTASRGTASRGTASRGTASRGTASRSTEDMMLQRPADAIVTDIFMPEMEGIETIHDLRREFPEAKEQRAPCAAGRPDRS